MNEPRCSLTELIVAQCAHCREAAFQVEFVEPPAQVEMGEDG